MIPTTVYGGKRLTDSRLGTHASISSYARPNLWHKSRSAWICLWNKYAHCTAEVIIITYSRIGYIDDAIAGYDDTAATPWLKLAAVQIIVTLIAWSYRYEFVISHRAQTYHYSLVFTHQLTSAVWMCSISAICSFISYSVWFSFWFEISYWFGRSECLIVPPPPKGYEFLRKHYQVCNWQCFCECQNAWTV